MNKILQGLIQERSGAFAFLPGHSWELWMFPVPGGEMLLVLVWEWYIIIACKLQVKPEGVIAAGYFQMYWSLQMKKQRPIKPGHVHN